MQIKSKGIFMDTITLSQMLYVAKQANKIGARGQRVINVIPPQSATSGQYDFIFVTDTPTQSATETDWREI
ncbi:MAG: hypothetical protein WC373_07730 [Smithella sp.]|jgi:hypothetical protein